uniref:Lipoprotein n=1 Tax=Panagrellus redivivus TaxID=6233 RepID=A0A7E4V8H4_PANRE
MGSTRAIGNSSDSAYDSMNERQRYSITLDFGLTRNSDACYQMDAISKEMRHTQTNMELIPVGLMKFF